MASTSTGIAWSAIAWAEQMFANLSSRPGAEIMEARQHLFPGEEAYVAGAQACRPLCDGVRRTA